MPLSGRQILYYAFFLYASFLYAYFLYASFRFCPCPFMPLSGLMEIVDYVGFLYVNLWRPKKSYPLRVEMN
jgi:hypothetical protein